MISSAPPLPSLAACLAAATLWVLPGSGAHPAAAFQGPEQSGPVVGLALSGGAARGLAHIGVIQELEARGIRVHVVAGTSMGSLVGGLYAMGLPGDSLEAVARRFNRDDVFDDRIPRSFLSPDQRLFDERVILTLPIRDWRVHLPEAAVEGIVVSRALARELWPARGVEDFDALARPFAAVATDLRTGEEVVLRQGDLVEAIRASIAIPGLLEPLERDDRLLVDGGVVRNLPAEEARALGAELLICSDVSRPTDSGEYRSMLDILAEAVTIRSQEDVNRQYQECDVVLRPVSEELAAADFQELETWIEIGRDAVRRQIPDIARAFTTRRATGTLPAFLRDQQRRQAPLLPDSVYVREIRFPGVAEEKTIRPARRALGVGVGDPVTAARMDRAMAALQATDLYDGVGYRILPAGDGTAVLEVDLRPVQRDRLGMGLRFDERYKASVLLSATLQNRLGYGSSTRLDARLGEELQIQLAHFAGRGVTSPVGMGFSAGFTRVPLAFTEGGQRFFEIRNEQVHVAGQVALVERQGGFVALEFRAEQVRERPQVGSGLSTRERRYASVVLMALRDRLDRAAFATRGSLLSVRSEWARRKAGTGADFRQHAAEARVAVPLASPLSLHVELFAGAAAGQDLPLYKNFFLGGSVTSAVLSHSHPYLHGLDTQDRWGRVAQAARVALQWEVRSQWFVTAMVNAGDVRERWAVKPEDWVGGWGVSVGHLMVLGPARLTLAGRDSWGSTRFSVELGRAF